MSNRVIVKGDIGNAVHSVAPDHIVTTADEIFDETLQQYQSEINQAKADKDHDAVAGHVAVFDNNGNPVDGGILTEGVYDVSEKNPTAGPNSDGKFTLEYILSNANTLIPASVRKGGMSIKFVQSSDNKYVQCRLMAQNFTTDVTKWAIVEEGVYVENPEFVRVFLDNEDKILEAIRADGTKLLPAGVEIKEKIDYEGNETTIIENPEFVEVRLDGAGHILWGIQKDGNVYFGAGVPQQVIDYIEKKIKDLSLDEYEDIVTFLGTLINEDKTLAELLNEKVNKVDGKSLIDEDVADRIHYEEAPDFIEAELDANGNIIKAIKQDGTEYFAVGIDVAEVAVEHSIDNPEYIGVFLDGNNRVLMGFTKEGNVSFGVGVPSQIKEYVDKNVVPIQNFIAGFSTGTVLLDYLNQTYGKYNDVPEYIKVETDLAGKILAGRTTDGAAFENVGLSTPKIDVGGTVQNNFEDPEDRININTDIEGKILSYRDKNGILHENVGIETNSLILSNEGMTAFQQALKDSGFNPGGAGDWSDYISNDGDNPLSIPEPKCARLNLITNYNLINLNKRGRSGAQEGVNYGIPVSVEFADMNGNYFKKEAIISGQGNSSMNYQKKNISIDFFDTSVEDGDAFKIKFGKWVSQDSFHLKAYTPDSLRCVGILGYKLYDEALKTRGIIDDYVWKRGLVDMNQVDVVPNGINDIDDLSLQIETGATCFPDGFPCIVYQNGEFWGLFSWQLKKHRDNYHLKKNKPKNIHLDGYVNVNTIFNGSIRWEKTAQGDPIEVRNPKDMVYATSHVDAETGASTYKYDEDNPGAFEIAGNSDGSTSYPTWEAGQYAVDIIVEHNGHLFINTVANNEAEPIYHAKNNADDKPDFKNKTGCGWINCTNTVKVKEYIIALSHVKEEVYALRTINTSNGDITIGDYGGIYNDTDNFAKGIWVKDPNSDDLYMSLHTTNTGNPLSDSNNWMNITADMTLLKETFEQYFDIDNLVDYLVISNVIQNWDGYVHNIQWFTYNGKKWFCALYDLDHILGAETRYYPWTESKVWAEAFMFYMIQWYYSEDAKARYAELRDTKVFDTNNIMELFTGWIGRIGVDYYNLEDAKWTLNKGEAILNDGWEAVLDEDGNPIKGTDDYDSTATYNEGDTCFYGKGNEPEVFVQRYSYKFKVKEGYTLTDVPPVQTWNFNDNVWRIAKWVKKSIENMDIFYNYNQN